MPASRTDRPLVLFTAIFVALSALLMGTLIYFATNRDTAAGPTKPLFLGLRTQLTKKIRDGGPLYFANPFGDNGFWLDVEHGTLVAYALDVPGERDCLMQWKGRRDAYVDCHDRDVPAAKLDQYLVTIGSRNGSPGNSVFVDLRRRLPAGSNADIGAPVRPSSPAPTRGAVASRPGHGS